MRRLLVLLLLLFWVPVCAFAEIRFCRPDSTENGLEIVFFDCWEGDAIFLRSDGECMMVDGGPSGTRENVLSGLKKLGVERFRYLFNTHFHDDHINGLTWIMREGYPVEEYIHPYNQHDIDRDELCTRAVETALKRGIPIRRVFDGDELMLGSAKLRLFRCMTIPNANSKSMVVRAEFGRATLLLCADIIGDAQQYYLANLPAELLKSDVIKIPHHGITPVDPEYLTAVDPSLAVITNNRARGFAAAKQLEGREIPILYSDDQDVYLYTDGTDWWAWQEQQLTEE